MPTQGRPGSGYSMAVPERLTSWYSIALNKGGLTPANTLVMSSTRMPDKGSFLVSAVAVARPRRDSKGEASPCRLEDTRERYLRTGRTNIVDSHHEDCLLRDNYYADCNWCSIHSIDWKVVRGIQKELWVIIYSPPQQLQEYSRVYSTGCLLCSAKRETTAAIVHWRRNMTMKLVSDVRMSVVIILSGVSSGAALQGGYPHVSRKDPR